jgi:hypothetical protein
MKTCVLALLCLTTVLVLSSSETFAQVQWIKYAGNPVLSGGEYGSWNRQLNMPCVLYNADSARFEMWFAASAYPYGPVFPYKIGFAFSDDGRS